MMRVALAAAAAARTALFSALSPNYSAEPIRMRYYSPVSDVHGRSGRVCVTSCGGRSPRDQC